MLNVILSIDERIDDVKNCVDSLRSVYGQGVKIALATYGGRYVKEQPLIIKYAIQEGFPYYSCPRQDWLTDDDMLGHCFTSIEWANVFNCPILSTDHGIQLCGFSGWDRLCGNVLDQ